MNTWIAGKNSLKHLFLQLNNHVDYGRIQVCRKSLEKIQDSKFR